MNDTQDNPGVRPPPEPAGPPQRRRNGLVIILGLAALALAAVWWRVDYNHQRQFELTYLIGAATGFLVFLHFCLFSLRSWQNRLLVLAAAVGSVMVFRALFRIQGVTGNLVPIIGWRSTPLPSAVIGKERPAAAAAPAYDFAPSTNDFPQFMGPHRDGMLAGPALARDWQAHPPQLLWRQPVGPAWSGFAVVGRAAVTQEQRGDEELVVCYERQTGQVLWSHADATHYRTTIAGEGPRMTPTIAGNRVFAMGATGILNCLELPTGRLVWTRNVLKENGWKQPEWGMSSAPLVLDRLVLVSTGDKSDKTLVAFDRESGQPVWSGGTGPASYSSPLPATLAGTLQVLSFNTDNVTGHDPKDGSVLWRHPWPSGNPHVALPVVVPGDRLLFSSGYGVGSELLQIHRSAEGKWEASRLWKSIRLKAKFTNPVQRDGYVYGLDDGILVCLDLSNGSLKWKEGRYGHGQTLLAGDLLLVAAEDGRIILLEPTPAGHRELAQFQALEGKCWNPPALAGEFLLVRNHLEAACYRLPLAQGAPPAAKAAAQH